MVIAFRGTEDFNDIWIDLQMIQECFHTDEEQTELFVHSGFKRQYDSVKHRLRNHIATKYDQYHPKRILITGHSLGGALATLCAFDLTVNPAIVDNDEVHMKIITLGAPPVGTDKFVEAFNKRITDYTRLRMKWDWITTQVPFTGYIHAGDKDIILREASSWLTNLTATRAHSSPGYVKGAINSKWFARERTSKLIPQ